MISSIVPETIRVHQEDQEVQPVTDYLYKLIHQLDLFQPNIWSYSFV